MIPYNVYNIWIGDKPFPEGWRFCLDSWKRVDPECNQVLLGDKEISELFRNDLPQFVDFYENRLARVIEKADFARLAIVYVKGGIYADIDVECVKSLRPLLNTDKAIMGMEPVEHAKTLYSREKYLCNAIFLSPARHPFWLRLMNKIVKKYSPSTGVFGSTGPMFFTKLWEKNPNLFDNVEITSPCVFYPLTNKFTDKSQGRFRYISSECDVEKQSFTVHHWATTWTNERIVKKPRGQQEVSAPERVVKSRRCKDGDLATILAITILLMLFVLLCTWAVVTLVKQVV
jgi:mannosyltransferase OCH1-like enzyme